MTEHILQQAGEHLQLIRRGVRRRGRWGRFVIAGSSAVLFLMLMSAPTVLSASVTAQDTVIIRADNEPVWGAGIEVEEDLRIGMLEAPDEYVFGRVGRIAVGLDSSIFVYDGHVPVVRQYDERGKFVRNIGRAGQGPGEYRGILGMAVLTNGNLVVWDVGNTRITVYDSAGQYVDSHRVPTSLHGPDVFSVDTLGNCYVKAIDMARMERGQVRQRAGGPAAVQPAGLPFMLIKVSGAGGVVDSIHMPDAEKDPTFVLMTADGPRFNFPTAVLSVWSPHGYLVSGRNSEYSFDLAVPGQPVRRIQRDIKPVRLHREERTQWEAVADQFRDQSGTEYKRIPAIKPAYRALFVDDDGRIWVHRYVGAVKRRTEPRGAGDRRPGIEWREPNTFDVIGPDGTYFGEVTVPERTIVHVRRGTRVWAVQRGAFDEDYVVRFKIVGEGQ